MTDNTRNTWDELDPKLGEASFSAWVRNSSLSRASDELFKLGFVTRSGRPYSLSHLQKNAYRWLAFHPNECRDIIKNLANKMFTDKEWDDFWITKSLQGVGSSHIELMMWIREFDVKITSITKGK